MKKIVSLVTILIMLLLSSCSANYKDNIDAFNHNTAFKELDIDFTYWDKTPDNISNQPLVEFGNGCIITPDADAGSAKDVITKLNMLNVTECDIDLSLYTNSVFIHRIALNTFVTRDNNTHYSNAGHKYAYQFWFYDDFKYMRITDSNDNQLGPVFLVSNSELIKELYQNEYGTMYISPEQYDKVERYLNNYFIGQGKSGMENLTKDVPNYSKIVFPEDFIFNVDYTRLSISATELNGSISNITGWTECNGISYSFNLFVNVDSEGNLIPRSNATFIYKWE